MMNSVAQVSGIPKLKPPTSNVQTPKLAVIPYPSMTSKDKAVASPAIEEPSVINLPNVVTHVHQENVRGGENAVQEQHQPHEHGHEYKENPNKPEDKQKGKQIQQPPKEKQGYKGYRKPAQQWVGKQVVAMYEPVVAKTGQDKVPQTQSVPSKEISKSAKK
ncbi:hypothetical protein K7X08_023002 [Anisodus acutangulus]|uniref:Uncharacterized protein n=1 Tax=Anisodus acutangulus TaxID=402998 RepID=A0A9Q1MC49_9SOLA|nr:hypothetical protein K7X08_023002 [Anisodus acutangulus]